MKLKAQNSKVQDAVKKVAIDHTIDKYAGKGYTPEKTALAQKHKSVALQYIKQRRSAKG